MKIIIISSILTFEDLFNMRTFNQLPLSHWALILCGEESDTRFLVFSNFETESYYFPCEKQVCTIEADINILKSDSFAVSY